MSTPISLAAATADDEAFLWEMLVEAAHLLADGEASAAVAQQHPFLAKVVRGWGRPDDLGVIARAATDVLLAREARQLLLNADRSRHAAARAPAALQLA